MGEKLLARVRYLYFNTRVNRWTTKAQRTRTRSATSKQKYPSLTERKKTITSETERDRAYGERVDDRLEAGYRELKRFGKEQSR